MQLSWQPGFSPSKRPVRRSRARRTNIGPLNGQQRFEFIVERPVRKTSSRSERPIQPVSRFEACSEFNGTSSPPVNYRTKKHSVSSCRHGGHCRYMSVKDTEYFIDASLDDLRDKSLVNSCESVDLHTTDGTAERRPSPYNSRSRCQAGHTWSLQSDNQLRIFEESKLGPSMFYEGSSASVSVPSGILYSDLRQRFRPILERCMTIPQLFTSAMTR